MSSKDGMELQLRRTEDRLRQGNCCSCMMGVPFVCDMHCDSGPCTRVDGRLGSGGEVEVEHCRIFILGDGDVGRSNGPQAPALETKL